MSERLQSQRTAEALVWAVVAATIILAIVFASPRLARSITIGALFCGANFSMGRIALARMLTLKGQAQRAFGLLYASKFSVLVGVLGVLTFALKLDVLGLVIGFSALPVAMYLLLVMLLLKRRRSADKE